VPDVAGLGAGGSAVREQAASRPRPPSAPSIERRLT
jgi:hypothetical protein